MTTQAANATTGAPVTAREMLDETGKTIRARELLRTCWLLDTAAKLPDVDRERIRMGYDYLAAARAKSAANPAAPDAPAPSDSRNRAIAPSQCTPIQQLAENHRLIPHCRHQPRHHRPLRVNYPYWQDVAVLPDKAAGGRWNTRAPVFAAVKAVAVALTIEMPEVSTTSRESVAPGQLRECRRQRLAHRGRNAPLSAALFGIPLPDDRN